MDKEYWKQYEADLIKEYMSSVMKFKGSSAWELEIGLRNAKTWARLTVMNIRESVETKED